LAHGSRLRIVLVHPEIAANTGSVGRTCVALGASLWLVRPLGFHLGERHRRRAGLDYWDHLDLHLADSLDQALAGIHRSRTWYFSSKARQPYDEVEYQPGDALVFGPESRGLSPELLATVPDQSVRIPILPDARCLNLAVAVAVAGFEAARQIKRRAATADPA
jgi:tRNA (cytidine/uridine-2'-O-)-methyltransferase